MNNDFIDTDVDFWFGYETEIKHDNSREKWHYSYMEELLVLYDIMITNILNKNPKLEIDHKVAFHNFSRLIFHGSSRRISPYTKALCQDT